MNLGVSRLWSAKALAYNSRMATRATEAPEAQGHEDAGHPWSPAPTSPPWAVVVPEVDPNELRASALRQARRLVEFYRITADELVGSTPATAVAPADVVEASTAAVRPVKYRHPVTGDTWDGVGAHPQWMRQALLQDGYRVAELLAVPDADTV